MPSFSRQTLFLNLKNLTCGLNNLTKEEYSDKVYILVGVAPLKSLKIAQYLHTNVPGVSLPEKILKRMEKAGESASEEGVQIALEVIDSVKTETGNKWDSYYDIKLGINSSEDCDRIGSGCKGINR